MSVYSRCLKPMHEKREFNILLLPTGLERKKEVENNNADTHLRERVLRQLSDGRAGYHFYIIPEQKRERPGS